MAMNTTFKKLCKRAGVTLTELLVVLVIISVLSTIAVPVYTQHSERARRATAIAEARNLAMGMETVGTLHGFYVPLQLLDDAPGGTLATAVQGSTGPDSIGNEGGINLIDFNQSILDLNSAQPTISTGDGQKVLNLINGWEGPFMSFQRYYVSPTITTITDSAARTDFPLDPWGNAYRLYSPIGIVGTGAISAGSTTNIPDNFGDGRLLTSEDLYDRFAVVSFGSDGLSAADTGIANQLDPEDDDIYYVFGPLHAARTESTFSPIPRAQKLR